MGEEGISGYFTDSLNLISQVCYLILRVSHSQVLYHKNQIVLIKRGLTLGCRTLNAFRSGVDQASCFLDM